MLKQADLYLPFWLMDEWGLKDQPYLSEVLTTGYSGAEVVRMRFPGEHALVLKMQPVNSEFPLKDEAKRIQWACQFLPTPHVLAYSADEMTEYLLMTNIEGDWPDDDLFAEDPEGYVRILAEGLRRLHMISPDNCPFDESLEVKLKKAEYRVSQDMVDTQDFDDEHKGKSPHDILAELILTRPRNEDFVVSHGDYCLPNILIENQKLTGFIDLGNLGVSDRHQDIALAARSLKYNKHEQYIPLLFDEYGISEIDPFKLQYFQLLDELF